MRHHKNESLGIRKTKTIGPSLKATLRRPWYIWSKNPPLSVTYPEIAKQWHKTKNGIWTPNDFTARSGIKVWWRCPKGPDHVYKTRIASRTLSLASGCPFCRGLKASVTNSLASLYPAIAKEWDKERNGVVTPQDVVAHSNKRFWWRCRNHHVWQTQVNERTVGHGCPYCSGRRVTPERSLSKHCRDIAKYWHPFKNGKLKPSEISVQSNKIVWWLCPKNDEHEWQAAVHTFTRALNSCSRGCPYCRGLRVSSSNSLAVRFPEIARELHPTKNNGLTADELSYGSFKEVWWQCQVDSRHIFQNRVSLRTGRSHGCPYCSGRRVSKLNSLASCYPKIARLWHKTRNKYLTPSKVSYGSHKKVWWQCQQNHEHVWQSSVYDMTGHNRQCHFCAKNRDKGK
jgi:hypothetical protein